MINLQLTGQFYPNFTEDNNRYSDEDKFCIQHTVERLLTVQTSAEKPGMLLGKIQSGKTKTFLAIIALAYDNGFDIAIILTKGTKALARQTHERVRAEFDSFIKNDQLQVFDIMILPSGLTPYELTQKLVFIAKKQSDNLDRLMAVFRDRYPQLADKRVLIVDDEADFASIGFRNSSQSGITVNTTTQQIDALRQLLRSSAFLQVTATPYALYLQPDDLMVQGVEFIPIKPAFTELVPVHQSYVGSDYYFDESTETESVASFIYQPVTLTELAILRQEDRRRFRIEECLTSNAIETLRSAICNFVIGGCIRRLQDRTLGNSPKKFSFLVHTEAARAAHTWQEQVVTALKDNLAESVERDPTLLRQLLTRSYEELQTSIAAMNHYLPPLAEVISEAFIALGTAGWLMITKVNSERQVEELLDEDGQLRLRTPLNIFIGGQILDRGITIANLIGFFYGRRPQVYQQDTVLQHSRMFGFRPIEDLTVTRFYTAPAIHDAMRRMHESDTALRLAIEQRPKGPIVFIQRDGTGQVVPCSPNKILASQTTTLRQFKRLLPVGFQTDYKTRIAPIVADIDKMLDDVCPSSDPEGAFEISWTLGDSILERIQPTLSMSTEEGYDFDWQAARAALCFMADTSNDPARRGKIWCLVRRNRNMSRYINVGIRQAYSDAPDTTHAEGRIARQCAIDSPMLMLFRQNGLEEKGWRGTPFYWPVIVAQRNLRTSIFAHKTTI